MIRGSIVATEPESQEGSYTSVRVKAEVYDVYKGELGNEQTVSFLCRADSDGSPFDKGPFQHGEEAFFFFRQEARPAGFEWVAISNSRTVVDPSFLDLLPQLGEAWRAYQQVPQTFLKKTKSE